MTVTMLPSVIRPSTTRKEAMPKARPRKTALEKSLTQMPVRLSNKATRLQMATLFSLTALSF